MAAHLCVRTCPNPTRPDPTLLSLRDRYGFLGAPPATQQQFAVQLARYVTDQVRRHAYFIRDCDDCAPNPTRLSDFQLNLAVRYFSDRVECSYTHKELAQRFLSQIEGRSFEEFKEAFYCYLTETHIFNERFNRRFCQYLDTISPDYHDDPLNEFLLIRTCTQVLNFLTIDNQSHRDHTQFLELTTHLGPIFTISLLLKILLVCPKVKPHLEKRFTMIFSHYVALKSADNQWLVEILEHLNLALTIHFGEISLPPFYRHSGT